MKMILIAATCFLGTMHSEDMKLVHTKSHAIIISFHDGRAQFYDSILAQEMDNLGVYIPPFKRGEFEGKKKIFPCDPLFQKAFVEVYYPLAIANPVYQWEIEKL